MKIVFQINFLPTHAPHSSNHSVFGMDLNGELERDRIDIWIEVSFALLFVYLDMRE